LIGIFRQFFQRKCWASRMLNDPEVYRGFGKRREDHEQ